jgi:uncharacterized protein
VSGTVPATKAAPRAEKIATLIDCDVHNSVPRERLARHLPERFRRHLANFGLRQATSTGYTRPRANGAMMDSYPPSGGVPGSDPGFMAHQLLDAWGHTYAILNPHDQNVLGTQTGEYAGALTRALNDAVIEDWLGHDARFYASICVPQNDGDLAVAEIERLAGHPRFVQVLIPLITREPVGSRRYWPLFDAAEQHGLPVAMHVAGWSGHPMTGAGWPSFYFENHFGFQQAFENQVISLVAEGVFDRFPGLKIVLAEGGFSFMPPLMWRLDRSYQLLRDSIPALERAPSEYCREHFWYTTQPIEEPERPEYLIDVTEALGADDKYLFSSDYPHWDFDAPDRAVPRNLSPELRLRILAGNALALYDRLPDPRTEDN